MQKHRPGNSQILDQGGNYQGFAGGTEAAIGLCSGWVSILQPEALMDQFTLKLLEIRRHGRLGEDGQQQDQCLFHRSTVHRSVVKGVAHRRRVSLLKGGNQRWISFCSRERLALVAFGTSVQKRMLS